MGVIENSSFFCPESGILFQSTKGFKISNCEFANMKQNGIWISKASNATLENNQGTRLKKELVGRE